LVTWKLLDEGAACRNTLDYNRANELLRYGIACLRGKAGIVASEKGKLELALIMKKDLARMGAWWQVKVLDHWIHRFQKGEFGDIHP